jgi:membrane protein DedA with SNARE-associated domain
MKRHRFAAVAGAGAMLAVAGFIGLGALMGELADRLNQS